MTSSGEAIRRTPRVATIDHGWTAPLGQILNDQRILKQCCCRFREMGSKTTLKAWYVKRLPTVAYVGAWLINSQATNHEPYQKCRPAKNFIHIQTNQARVRRKKVAAKALAISPKGGPRFGVQKTGPVWGSVFYVDIARYSFSNMEPKKGVHFSTSKLWFIFVVFLLLLLHFCA